LKLRINSSGNSGMATAGSGDVLSGIIAALLAQGMNLFDSASIGAYIHGLSGDIAKEKLTEFGMIASDIIDNIPYAFKKLV
jgi:NAD(P)H-hydrate epimerase